MHDKDPVLQIINIDIKHNSSAPLYRRQQAEGVTGILQEELQNSFVIGKSPGRATSHRASAPK